ncbi:ERG4/ERG24 ergosterol biosynthesis protein [Aspergillus ruber CBS 135680]|uniref:Delta(14)-sterol reductase n=1 Tax=Aspergillus ruber (strain CBS 135680) TaxID=1388766 RepID=A0A017SEZ0_ASPRC|nr:ERG4/ERG24 ergosterol biosynthesis protein [Aspergillus ruber CBS 135680]EYE94825.1 ERG4/ERG24 ergosterol biosynthesis protein [Aspergillus ruber CBS 135680]
MAMEYEFGGPLVVCNDVAGCPILSLLPARPLTWANVKADTGLLNLSISNFVSWEAIFTTTVYYVYSLLLWRIFPAKEVHGTKLVHHGRPLSIFITTFSAIVVTLAVCAAGTYLQGAHFAVWAYISDHYVQLLTANILTSYGLSAFLYICSFSVNTKYPNRVLRELAAGAEPPVTFPFFGEIDIKTWCEVCPGLTGWILLDLAFIVQQYRSYGYISDSIVFTMAIQAYYVLSSQYNGSSILTMMDITTDGMGFMLSFGHLVWVPFLYSTQCRYLAAYPMHLGWTRITVTKRGTRLLAAGWWGIARYTNYFGDWLQALPFSLPTGLAGYIILPGSVVADASQAAVPTLDDREVDLWGFLVII